MSIYKQGQTPFKSGRKIRRVNKLDAAHSASIKAETEAEGTLFRGAVSELCDYNKIQKKLLFGTYILLNHKQEHCCLCLCTINKYLSFEKIK